MKAMGINDAETFDMVVTPKVQRKMEEMFRTEYNEIVEKYGKYLKGKK